MKILSEKFILTAFSFALLILLIIGYITYKSIDVHFEDESILNEKLIVTQTSEALIAALYDASSNRRGYLITLNDDFLNDYNAAIKNVDSLFLKLRTLTASNPIQQKLLDSIQNYISNRKELFTESLEKQEQKRKNISEQIPFTEQGRITQENIKNLIMKFEEENNNELKNRNESLDKSASVAIISLFLGLAVSFILLIFAFALLHRNIKYRIQYEKTIEESRNWFSTTLASIGDAVIVTDHLGDIAFMNKVAENLTGWTFDEAQGLYLENIFNIVNEITRQKVDNPLQMVLKRGKVIGLANHTILITKQNKEIPIDDSAAPILSNELKLLGIVLVFRDITNRRKTEIALENSRKFSQKITDTTPNIIYIYNLKGPEVIYVNNNIKQTLGYSPDDVIKMGDRFFSSSMLNEDYKKLTGRYKQYLSASDNEILENTYRIKNNKGEWRWMESFDVIFSRDESGTPIQILGSAIDITHRVSLENELKKYSAHLEELVDNRTHQLRVTNEKLQSEILERIKADKNIADAEERFRGLVENSLVGIYIIQEGKFSYVNPKLEEIFGYDKNEIIGMGVKNLVHEDDYPNVIENIRKRLNKEIDTIQYNFRGITKNNQLRDLEVKGTSLVINGINSIIGTLVDVTEMKKAEQELKDSEEKFRILAETASDGIITIDNENKITFLNNSVEKIFGYSSDELLNKEINKIIPDEFQSTGSKFECSGLHKNGNNIPIEISFGEYFTNDKNYITGIIRDITERKKAEVEIKNQKEYLRKVIDTDPNFIFAKDWNGQFTLVNKAVANTYGTTVEDLIGKTDADFNPIQEEVDWFLKDDREVMSSLHPKIIPEETVYNAKTKEQKWYQTIKVPLIAPNGDKQVLGISTDITARKIAEESTIKSLKEKELLLQEIHHRVKNNLQIIVSLLKLQSKHIFDARDLDIFNKSRARVETMSLIHEKLYKSSDLENINIGVYLKDLTSYLINAYGVTHSSLDVKINAKNVHLGIDSAIPCGLIINELFSNALKHAFLPEQAGVIEINVTKEADKINLTVSDNGRGIPENYDITKTESLGLQLVCTLVKQLDGTMKVTNSNGTKFCFSLKEPKYRERI